jgi:VanZ family protein
VVILYESTRPGDDAALPDVSTGWAYVGHFVSYAALAFCAQMALLRRNLFMVCAITTVAAICGGLLEAYQSTLTGREASILDALANLLGAGGGALVAAYVAPRWERIRS